jgi:hypothetical protein
MMYTSALESTQKPWLGCSIDNSPVESTSHLRVLLVAAEVTAKGPYGKELSAST